MTCPGSHQLPLVIDLDHRGRGYCPTCTRRYRLDHLHRLATHREPS